VVFLGRGEPGVIEDRSVAVLREFEQSWILRPMDTQPRTVVPAPRLGPG
jgi:hypothetical protein